MLLTVEFKDQSPPKKINFQTRDELDEAKHKNMATQLLRKRVPGSEKREFEVKCEY